MRGQRQSMWLCKAKDGVVDVGFLDFVKTLIRRYLRNMRRVTENMQKQFLANAMYNHHLLLPPKFCVIEILCNIFSFICLPHTIPCT